MKQSGTANNGGTSIRIDEDGSGGGENTDALAVLTGITPNQISTQNFVIG